MMVRLANGGGRMYPTFSPFNSDLTWEAVKGLSFFHRLLLCIRTYDAICLATLIHIDTSTMTHVRYGLVK